MSTARYAIYLAPSPDTPLWRFGSRVVGYDALTGEDMVGFAPGTTTPDAWRVMTAEPRNYGFHATLKAPFRLAPDVSLPDLENELSGFCTARAPFDLGPLGVKAIGGTRGNGFIALTETRQSGDLAALETAVVAGFDRFRAPLTESERSRRRPERLTPRQLEMLDRFGYPYCGPDYRFHMTLSGSIPDSAELADELADEMANEIGTAHLKVDALVLFGQVCEEARFRILRRFDLQGAALRS